MSGSQKDAAPELKVGGWIETTRRPYKISRIISRGALGVLYHAVREDDQRSDRSKRGSS